MVDSASTLLCLAVVPGSVYIPIHHIIIIIANGKCTINGNEIQGSLRLSSLSLPSAPLQSQKATIIGIAGTNWHVHHEGLRGRHSASAHPVTEAKRSVSLADLLL